MTLCYSFHHCLSWKRDWWTFDDSNCLSQRVPMGIVRSRVLFRHSRGPVRNSYLRMPICIKLTVSVAVGLDSVQGDQLLTVEVGNLCDRLLLLVTLLIAFGANYSYWNPRLAASLASRFWKASSSGINGALHANQWQISLSLG